MFFKTVFNETILFLKIFFARVYLCEDSERNQFALKAIGRDLLNEDKERLFNNEVHCLQKLRAKHTYDGNEIF